MKKIEPGCLCILLGKYFGWPVIAVDRAQYPSLGRMPDGHDYSARTATSWIIETQSRPFTETGKVWQTSERYALCDESMLRRIDGHEPEQTTEQLKEVATC